MKKEKGLYKKAVCFGKNRYFVAALSAVMAAGLLCAPAMAAKSPKRPQTVSENGLVMISLPDESWAELPSKTSAACFADGASMIRVDLYKNGQELPTVAAADQNYEMVFENVISNNDWVIVTTGLANEVTDYAGIAKAIKNMKLVMEFLPGVYDQLGEQDGALTTEDVSYTAWVKATELNVREEPDHESGVVDILPYASEVNVTGEVKKDGKDYGWVRVSLNGKEGYVSSEFIQKEQIIPQAPPVTVTPDNPDEPVEPQIVDSRTVYLDGSGDPMTLYGLSDGTWQNGDGVRYQYVVELDAWIGDDGTTAYDDPIGPEPYFTYITVHDDEGEYVTIYQIESGEWTDGDGRFFDYDEEGDCWLSDDGYYFWQ